MIGTYDRVKAAIIQQLPVKYYCPTMAVGKHIQHRLADLIPPTDPSRHPNTLMYGKCQIWFRIPNTHTEEGLLGFRGVVFIHPELNIDHSRFREFAFLVQQVNGRHGTWLQ